MARKGKETTPIKARRQIPARSPEERETQMCALAYDLVEKRLREGTATSQETTFFLKLGSTKERIEREMMKEQQKLLEAKTEAIQAAKKSEEAYEKVLNVLRMYNGADVEEDESYDE